MGSIIAKPIIHNSVMDTYCEIVLRWISQIFISETSLLVQVPGTKPLPEPIMIQIYVTILDH